MSLQENFDEIIEEIQVVLGLNFDGPTILEHLQKNNFDLLETSSSLIGKFFI